MLKPYTSKSGRFCAIVAPALRIASKGAVRHWYKHGLASIATVVPWQGIHKWEFQTNNDPNIQSLPHSPRHTQTNTLCFFRHGWHAHTHTQTNKRHTHTHAVALFVFLPLSLFLLSRALGLGHLPAAMQSAMLAYKNVCKLALPNVATECLQR